MFCQKDRKQALLEIISKMNKSSISLTGFTLTELIVVIIIIGILVTLALPQFGATRERALGREARANLRLIAAAERIYRMEVNVYFPGDPLQPQDAVGNINSYLKLDLTEANWDYVISGGPNDFTATADRPGSSGYLDCQYTLTDNDADGEPDANASCP